MSFVLTFSLFFSVRHDAMDYGATDILPLLDIGSINKFSLTPFLATK